MSDQCESREQQMSEDGAVNVSRDPAADPLVEFREFEPLTRLHAGLPRKAQRGLRNLSVEFTCIDANHNFVALGTNIGRLILYDRKTEAHSKIHVEEKKGKLSSVSCVKLCSALDELVALGTSDGVVLLFLLYTNVPGVSTQMKKFQVDGLHEREVSCLEFSSNGMKLFSGDGNGLVVCTEADFDKDHCESAIVVREESAIVQLSYTHRTLLVSTRARAMLCHMDDQLFNQQVGHQPRKILGRFGACFVPEMVRASEAQLYASRPGLRLWKADMQGRVLETIMLKDQLGAAALATSPPAPLHMLPDSLAQYLPRTLEGGFGPLACHCHLLVTWTSTNLCVVDPQSRLVVGAVAGTLGHISGVAVTPQEIFILRKTNDPGQRLVLRVAAVPEDAPAAPPPQQLPDQADSHPREKSFKLPIDIDISRDLVHEAMDKFLPKKLFGSSTEKEAASEEGGGKPESSVGDSLTSTILSVFDTPKFFRRDKTGGGLHHSDSNSSLVSSEGSEGFQPISSQETTVVSRRKPAASEGQRDSHESLGRPLLVANEGRLDLAPAFAGEASGRRLSATAAAILSSGGETRQEEARSTPSPSVEGEAPDECPWSLEADPATAESYSERSCAKDQGWDDNQIVFIPKTKRKKRKSKQKIHPGCTPTALEEPNEQHDPSLHTKSASSDSVANRSGARSAENTEVHANPTNEIVNVLDELMEGPSGPVPSGNLLLASDGQHPVQDTLLTSESPQSSVVITKGLLTEPENQDGCTAQEDRPGPVVQSPGTDPGEGAPPSGGEGEGSEAGQLGDQGPLRPASAATDMMAADPLDSSSKPGNLEVDATAPVEQNTVHVSVLVDQPPPPQDHGEASAVVDQPTPPQDHGEASAPPSQDPPPDSAGGTPPRRSSSDGAVPGNEANHPQSADTPAAMILEGSEEKEVGKEVGESGPAESIVSSDPDRLRLQPSGGGEEERSCLLPGREDSLDPEVDIYSMTDSDWPARARPGQEPEEERAEWVQGSSPLPAALQPATDHPLSHSASAESVNQMSDTWRQLTGPGPISQLTVCDTGLWCVDHWDHLHFSPPSVAAGLTWKKLKTTAKQISVSQSGGLMWLVERKSQKAFAAARSSPGASIGSKWVQADQNVEHVCVDEDKVWIVKAGGELWMQKGLSRERQHSKSIRLSSDQQYELKQLALAPGGGAVWALTTDGQVVFRAGLKKDKPEGVGWRRMEGVRGHEQLRVVQIALDGGHTGWAVDHLGRVWFRTGVTSQTPQGDNGRWWQVSISDYMMGGQDTSLIHSFLAMAVSEAQKPVEKVTSWLKGHQPAYMIAANSRSVWVSGSKNELYVSEGSLVGSRWECSTPLGLSVTSKWAAVCSSGVVKEAGCVWALMTNGEIFCMASHSLRPVPVAAPSLSCSLHCLSVTPEAVWCLATDGSVYIRSGLDSTPHGLKWTPLQLQQLGSVKLGHLCCGSQCVWACDLGGGVYFRMDVRAPHSALLTPAWVPVNGKAHGLGAHFTQVCVGTNDRLVWALDNKRNVYVRRGITREMPIGCKWELVPGTPALELCISRETVWALCPGGDIACRYGISQANSLGDYWKKVPGNNFAHLSVTPDDELWAIDKEGQLFRRFTKPLLRGTSSEYNIDDWEVI